MDGLIGRGFDVVRAVDIEPEGTDDIDHFEHAVRLGRVLIANDKHMKAIAERWIAEERPFPGLIWWPRKSYAIMSNAEILEAIEQVTTNAGAFAYPIEFIKPKPKR